MTARWHHLCLGAAMAGLIAVFDASFRGPTLAALSLRELREFGAALLGSVTLWWALATLLSGQRRRPVTAIVASALGAMLFVQGAVLLTYRRLPDDEGALFFANQWRFALKTAAQSRDVRALGLLVAIGASLTLFAWLARRHEAPRRLRHLAALTLCGVVGIAFTARLSAAMPITADLNAVRFALRVASWHGAPPPFFAMVERKPSRTLAPPMPFNVLWLVHETLGARYLLTPDGREVTPALLALKQDPSVVWLDRLHAVSDCTDVSLPSILSGVSSAAGHPAQASAVLPFDVAHDNGAFTFVVSAQSLAWANQDRYLGREHFDSFRAAEDFDPRADGDEGIPDELAFGAALESMNEAERQGRPFMGLLRTNGPHGPYRVDPQDSPWPADPGFGLGESGGFPRYLNALHRLDREFGRFWEQARRQPWFARTLVVITADHGEAFNQHGLLWHCGAFYPEESWVPGALKLPVGWAEANQQRHGRLRERATDTAFLIDLAPTVSEMLGWSVLSPQFDGQPLWSDARTSPVPFTNCSDFRRCADVDFGIYEAGLRWVYSGTERRWRAFDERRDPDALVDLAAEYGGAPTSAINQLEAHERLGAVTRRVLGSDR